MNWNGWKVETESSYLIWYGLIMLRTFCCFCVLPTPFLVLRAPSYFFAGRIHVSLFFKSFPVDSSDSSGFRNSLIASSHLCHRLLTGLFFLMLLSRPGFHSFTVFDHRSSGSDAVLNAILNFILKWIFIHHGIFVFIMRSSAFIVLLLIYLFHLLIQFLLYHFICCYLHGKNITVLITIWIRLWSFNCFWLGGTIIFGVFWSFLIFFWPVIEVLFFFCFHFASSFGLDKYT